MAQRFLSLEEAADQLGIPKDRLLALREANKVTGYKDGASWKFRSEAIEKLATGGIPSAEASPSDLALNLDDEDDDFKFPADSSPALPTPASSDPELGLADDELLAEQVEETAAKETTTSGSDLSLDAEEMVAGPASDLNLDDVDEPTVAGLDEGSDDALAIDDDGSIDINTDSILLSEAELGGSLSGSPSTIIGKADLDADLDLSPLDKGAGPASDVRLAGDSDLLPVGDDDLGLDLASPSSGNFEGLEELEVDLEAESSRILAPDDVAKAQAAAKAAGSSKKKPASKSGGISDLDLAPIDSQLGLGGSDINLGGEKSSKGSSGALAGLSALELDDDDDQVLGDGSDVTLSGQSSGINIISPSDSGLALDEVPLDLSGSAPLGSSLDLGMGSSVSESDVSLEPLAINVGADSQVGDFQLTPLGDDDGDDEKDSSQVIALDEISEDTGGAPLASNFGEAGMMSEDFGMGLSPGATPVALAPAGAETPFSLSNVMALAACLLVVGLCGMMTYDLLRNIWSWDGVGKINSGLLQVLNPFLGR